MIPLLSIPFNGSGIGSASDGELRWHWLLIRAGSTSLSSSIGAGGPLGRNLRCSFVGWRGPLSRNSISFAMFFALFSSSSSFGRNLSSSSSAFSVILPPILHAMIPSSTDFVVQLVAMCLCE